MSQETLYRPGELIEHMEDIEAGEIIPYSIGGFGVALSLYGQPLVLQTPWCHAPFGVDIHHTDNNGKKYSVTVNLNDQNGEHNEFAIMLQKLDKTILGMAVQMKDSLFAREIKQLEQEFQRGYRTPTSDVFPHTFKMKVPVRYNRIDCSVFFRGQSKPIRINNDLERYLIKGAKVRGIVQLSPVWFMKDRWGVSYKALQLEISVPPQMRSPMFLK